MRPNRLFLHSNELRSRINIGREQLASQFATMNGWQAGQCERFDAYIKEKRRVQRFEGFDQRVERAYREASKLHKAEVVNGFKRRLKQSGKKFDAQTMLDMRRDIDDRLQWLREVWAQVDADYRSEDTARQALASKEISAALEGDAGEYMAWVYDVKKQQRFAGPKEKMALEEELAGAELPDVSKEEVNRFHNLPIRMSTIEANVKERFGLAGEQHWALLQEEKDKLYEQKLDESARVYHKLLEQSGRYDESRRTIELRQQVERVHQAQVRFRAAMELEKEREAMVNAHEKMEAERRHAEKERRLAMLKEAAKWKAQGVPPPEIAARLKEKQLEYHARQQTEYQLKEEESIRAAQHRYRAALRDLKRGVEEREGIELMGQGAARGAPTTFDEPSFESAPAPSVHSPSSSHSSLESEEARKAGLESTSASLSRPEEAAYHHKKALWSEVNSDTYEDPFRVVHQARLDAAKNYDSIYAKYFPTSLALGKKYSRQGTGEDAAGNEMDKQVFQKSRFVLEPYMWGVRSVHDLDSDGAVNYLTYTERHVQDKRTGDIDWRYERKKGGPVFRGPRLYRMGAQREARDAGEQPMDPSFVSQTRNAALAAHIKESSSNKRSDR